jgi:hypothetical protein
VPFVRVLCQNWGIWKQFFEDILLNHEYPFNIKNILEIKNIEINEYATSSIESKEWKSQ